MEIGHRGYRVELRPAGWLGRFLRLEGRVTDEHPPVCMTEYVDLLALYLLEKEEEAEAARKIKDGSQ